MAPIVSILACALLAVTSVQSVRVPQYDRQPQQAKSKAVNRGFQGRFATGGPHSQMGNQGPVAVAPRISNKAHLVRPGKKKDLDNALERPYEALFGHPGVNGKNYRNVVYSSLEQFESTVLDA